MPKFYFDIRQEGQLLRDDEGSEQPNFEHALEEARASARDLAKQNIDARRSIADDYIEIRGEDGKVIAAVHLDEELDHPHRSPFEGNGAPVRH
jgi:hypothetical protein